MEISFFTVAALLAGLYMAWNIGANDLANSMGTSVGSKAVTLRQAILISGSMVLLGSLVFGSPVTETIRKGIVPPQAIGDPHLIAIGAFSAVIAAGIWVSLATWKKLPVSTTHSIVGAMMGFGLIASGLTGVNWGVLLKIVASWVISPLAGGVTAFIIFSFIRNFILRRVRDLDRTERIFAYSQVLSASYIAFALGSNDVANAIGPVAAALTYGVGGAPLGAYIAVPKWLFFIGGMGIVLGISTWGYRVIETIGMRVTEITPSRGFSAEFSTASIVLANTYLGMPISTTHTLVGSVIGVGVARGIKSLNLAIIRDIILSWLVTVPITAIISAVIFWIIKTI